MTEMTGAPAPPKRKGSRKTVRIVYQVLLWLFLATILMQALFIGLGIFSDARFSTVHVEVGWIFHLLGILMLIVGFFARLGWRLIVLNALTIVVLFVLPILAAMRQDLPVAAGLHPVTAVLLYSLALYLALRVRSLVPPPWGSAAPEPAAPQSTAPRRGRVLEP